MKIIFSFLGLLLSFHSFCQYENIKPQGIYSSNFMIDEKPRSITYYMPSSYGKQETYSLLIILHPEKSDAAAFIKKYGEIVQAKADSAGCIVLYPEAYQGHWNNALNDSINDVGFINIMAEFFARQFDCDLGEMRMLGAGSGGDICYRFRCKSIYKPVAIATMNAAFDSTSFSNCRNTGSVVHINRKAASISKSNIAESLSFLFAYQR